MRRDTLPLKRLVAEGFLRSGDVVNFLDSNDDEVSEQNGDPVTGSIVAHNGAAIEIRGETFSQVSEAYKEGAGVSSIDSSARIVVTHNDERKTLQAWKDELRENAINIAPSDSESDFAKVVLAQYEKEFTILNKASELNE